MNKPKPVRVEYLLPLLLIMISLISADKAGDSKNEGYNALAQVGSPSSDFNIATVGDMACTEDARNSVDNLLNLDPELIIGLGDYSYENTEDCWFDIIDPIDEKMKIAIGNHDIVPPKLNPLMTRFNLTNQYYSFDYQNVHFLIMSTETEFHTGSEQFEFVYADLSKAAENPNIKWIFVFLHKTMYSPPSGKVTSFEDPLRITYHPLFDRYGVDLVLQGHFHTYERTYPLNFNDLSAKLSLTTPQLVDATNGNSYINPKGPVFVIVGTGGAELHELQGKRPYVVTRHLGFGVLDVSVLKNGSTIDARFHSNNGTVKDEFTITKTNNSSDNTKAANSLYHYMPYIVLSGSNYTDIELDSGELAQFSVATWFNVSSYSGGRNDILNGANYAIWLEDDGRIRASYERNDGEIVMISSPQRYNDNKWHHAVITYDGSLFRLYIDNVLTTYTHSNRAPEDKDIQSIRIGGGSFIGNVDEIRIWNRALSANEIEQGYSSGRFDDTGQILHLKDLEEIRR